MNKKNINQKGFTLIEMIVVIILVVIISSIALFQIASYRKGVYLESTADEIALTLRKAQSLALAVKSTGGLLPVYQNGYGVHFELGNSPFMQGADEKSYILFTDYESFPGPGGWDRAYRMNMNPMNPCGSPNQAIDECVEKIEIVSGDKITGLSLCSIVSSTPTCTPLLPGQGLDITFLRPNLDAYFCTTSALAGGCRGLVPNAGYAQINLASPTGTTKSIKVWSTGQISIE